MRDTEDTPRNALLAALSAVGERAVYVRVEINDLRAVLAEEEHGDGDGCPCYNRGFDHGLSTGERS